MSLKLSTNNKGEVRLTWVSDDTEMEAVWKFRTDDGETEILEKLEKACRFIRAQRGEQDQVISELERSIRGDDWTPIPTKWVKQPSPPAAGEVIPMGPPAPNDLPAGGPPAKPGNGWVGLTSLTEPPRLPQHSIEAGWEYIPPGEM